MADRWMDERDRRWRERDWRRSEDYGRGERGEERYLEGEDRSWGGAEEDERGLYGGGRSAGYGAGESYGRGESRIGGGRGSAYRGGAVGRGGRPGWQDRDYGGVSPAMEQGEYDAEREAERYGQSGGYYGAAPRGYEAERERRMEPGRGRFERGYGEGGRERYAEGRFGVPRDEGRWQPTERGERWERGGREAGDFFRRAGERVASWFGGGEMERGEMERREARDFRGMGPKGYTRADERISDEVHERLTDDPWVDASNISVSVSGGEVTLSGTVEHREAKHRAERIVEDITGVSHVQNNLRVDRGGSSGPTPASISADTGKAR